VSVSTMWRTSARTDWTYKKRRWARPSAMNYSVLQGSVATP
jgi:hypothetical protein